MQNYDNEIIFEKYFPTNLTKDKQQYILSLIEKTKEFTDNPYPLNGINTGTLISLNLKEANDSIIHMSGFYYIGKENRCLEGEIYFVKNTIYIDSLITRLGDIPNNESKIYRNLDSFRIQKEKTKKKK